MQTDSRSLMEHFSDAYVGRRGAVLGPGLPGWNRVSQLTSQAAWYRPGRIDGRSAAWLDGIGATVGFPVGPEGPGLRMISVWLYPAMNRQAASVFLDGRALGTIRLKSGWQRYDFPLPPSGLGEGEHRLRFWFRHVTHRRRMKTPAALALIELRSANEPPAPVDWFEVADDGARYPLAGPPSRWNIDLMVPDGAVLRARGRVERGGPVDFIVRVDQDQVGRLEVARVKGRQGNEVELEVSLERWAGQIIRLSFGTDGMPGELERAQWRDVRLDASRRVGRSLPPVRNVLIWSVEGMWSGDPGFGREGNRAPTPNLDLLYQDGATALRTWSGGSGAREGHTRIIGRPGKQPFVESLVEEGLVTGLFSANPRFEKRLQTGFQTRFVPTQGARKFHPEPVLTALNDWIYAHGRKRFFAYVDATALQPGKKQTFTEGRWARDSQSTSHEILARNDYWLGRMMGVLRRYNVLKDTAIIIVGIPSRSLGLSGGNPHHPDRLHTPVVFWHPTLRSASGMAPRLYRDQGPDLLDLRVSTAQFLGLELGLGTERRSLLSVLFAGETLPRIPLHARTPYGWVVAYGPWIYWPRAKQEDRLWRHDEREATSIDAGVQPIVSRALRDRIATIPGR